MDSPIDARALALPLRQGATLRTTDVEAVREEVSRLVAPHEVTPVHGGGLDAYQTAASIGSLTLFQIHYGADVRIQADGCGPNYVIKAPVSGAARLQSRGQTLDAGVGAAGVLNPDLPLTFDYDADCTQLVLCIPAEQMERQLAQLVGLPELTRPLHFDLGMSLAQDAGQRWLRLLTYLSQEAGSGTGLGSALITAPLEQMVMNTLLSIQRHSYSDALMRPVSAAAPRHVVRAEAYMEAHASEALTPAQIAAAVGVSERALFRGFQDFRGMSPMARLKGIRLEQVHHALLAGTPQQTSVTEVALRWGFAHLGHFGEAYRRRFGETPIETLRR